MDEEKVNEDDLEEVETFHTQVNEMLAISGIILDISRQTSQFSDIDALTEKLDKILIEMRHGNWLPFIG